MGLMPPDYDRFYQLLNGDLQPSKVLIDDLDRRKARYQGAGWLYALRNPAFREGLLKIGKTARFPTERADELGRATGVPEGFRLIHYVHVGDRHQAERLAHTLLADDRLRDNREFFEVSIPKVAQVFDRVASQFPLIIKSGRQNFVIPQDFGGTKMVRCRGCGEKIRIRTLYADVRFRCSSCGKTLPG